MTGQDAGLASALRAGFASQPPQRLGVAVSGGGDSVALLVLLADWARAGGGPELAVVTVDHGLRAAAADEAAAVARLCTELGVPHETLRWQWDGAGNLSDRARRARLQLIGGWALRRGIGEVALGHTADDQAETFLMRLARGSGVDGLAGMAVQRQAEGVLWLRPLLAVRRAALRAFLIRRGIGWADDPTNEDDAYDRVRARRVLAALAPLGVDTVQITGTMARLALAREALERIARQVAAESCRIVQGDVIFARERLEAAPEETRLRLFSHALRWVGGAEYRPRLAAVRATLGAALAGRRRTLAGCLVSADRQQLRVAREYAAVRDLRGAVADVWDRRWRLTGPAAAGQEVRALGEAGLRQCADWRASGLPRASALASPAVWAGAVLVAAPLAGFGPDWRANPVQDEADFLISLLSH